MKSRSFFLKAICLAGILFFLFYLYQFGYRLVDKAFKVNLSTNNIDRTSISGHYTNYSEIVFPVIIVLLILIVIIGYKRRSNNHH